MFFVFFPIDVVFADSRFNVVDIKENFKPFTLYRPKNKSKYVIELPHRAIRNSNIKIGDRIKLTATNNNI